MREQIYGAPLAVDQIKVFGNASVSPDPVGVFVFNQSSAVKLAFELATSADEPPNAFEVGLDVVSEFTVQMAPTFNPYLLLVFGNKNNVSIKDSSNLFFLYCCGYDTDGPAPPPGGVGVGTPDIYAGRKFVTGQNTFGPQRLPGDYKFFRAYNYDYGNGASRPTVQRVLGDDAVAPNLQELQITFALVTFYGN